MRFEKEVNIYGNEVVLNRFQATETSIEVVQGKISALISESELIELENSQATMYSKLASAIMDIDSLDLQFSELNTKYNTVSGQYTELDSKMTQVEISVNGLSANVSQVSQNLADNYSTTTQMQSAIELGVKQISLSVENGESSSKITLLANGAEIHSALISMYGLVKFTDLTDSGSTVINGSNIIGGTIKLGGANNGNGRAEVYDSNGSLIGKWDSDGFSTIGKHFSVDENGETFSTRFYCTKLMMAPTIAGDDLQITSIKEQYSTALLMGQTYSVSTKGNFISIGEGRTDDPLDIVSIKIGGKKVVNGVEITANDTTIHGDLKLYDNLKVMGEKNRTVNTDNFGQRLLSSYEMTSPVFGDMGTAKTDKNGECIIYIDDIFYETIKTDIEYHVFLQAEGDGVVFVESKKNTYFVIRGAPDLKFSWEIKAKQRAYEYNRLEVDAKDPKIISAEYYLPTSIVEELEEILYEKAD